MSTHIKDDWEVQAKKDIADSQAKIADLIANNDLQDEDGYPTDAALNVIRLWHWNDAKGWFKFIEALWYMRDWGWKEIDEPHDRDQIVHRYYISTAGWSGNESIIYAMSENKSMLWTLTWVQSRRGGHYIFELREIDNQTDVNVDLLPST